MRSGGSRHDWTYLLFGVTVAAHSPQVFESSPQEDYEETPKESDHGGGEESPPHPLAVAVTGHIWWKRDDHVHLGYVDGRIRVELLPVSRHFRFLVTCRPPPTTINSTGIQALWGAPASAPWCPSGSAMLSRPPPAPQPSHLASSLSSKSWIDSRRADTNKKKRSRWNQDIISVDARSWLEIRVILWSMRKKKNISYQKNSSNTHDFPQQPRWINLYKYYYYDTEEACSLHQAMDSLTAPPCWAAQLSAGPLLQLRSAHCWMRSSREKLAVYRHRLGETSFEKNKQICRFLES